ncbi:MAG TPA: 3-deoxy-D-manno-octulosonic acid transferase [Rhodospirillaceae bacterium]|nr:3-deoxy-D-manno-octulosonic acid transferase [Rhodospirillaceae bacterium]HAA93320.1 3-deoxy-D-manno-octulosonic acid transferase [Rhodospirillaceae bacterium]HAT35625.1 3-deoxy-D-manno-octulosonic acid transferase [Rhodospirillaceae bacterium]
MSGLALYRNATLLAPPLAHLMLNLRRAKGKEDGARLSERKGIPSLARPAGRLAWLHAASVGEAQSSLVLIERLLDEFESLHMLVTTGTVTSAAHLEDRLPVRAFHQYLPLDCPQWVERFLDHWAPDLAIWMESELWPNLVSETMRRSVPALLVNARMSASSFRAWRRMDGMARHLISGFQVCLAQTDEQADRLRQLGAGNVSSPGNLKYSAAPLAFDQGELEELQSAIGARPVWVAASTHAGEEIMVSNAHTALLSQIPDLLTVIVPRHPHRAGQIETVLAQRGHSCVRRSTGAPISRDTAIYIADTLGELGIFYRLARIAYIGGSMASQGGHNPLEAAQLGCAILHGPDMENFQSVAEALAAEGGALTVRSAPEMSALIGDLFEDRDLWLRRTQAAAKVAKVNQGVIDRVFNAIAPTVQAALTRKTDAGA